MPRGVTTFPLIQTTVLYIQLNLLGIQPIIFKTRFNRVYLNDFLIFDSYYYNYQGIGGLGINKLYHHSSHYGLIVESPET